MLARTLIAAVTLALLAVPLAAAQEPIDPAKNRVDGKVAQATTSPQEFVSDHASLDGAKGEAEWGVAYGCYVVDYAHDEHGTPDPDLEQCENYEEVIGVEAEEEEDDPVASVEEIEEGPVAEAEELKDDALGSVEEIVEDPENAPGILLKLVGGVVLFVLYVVDFVVETVKDALGAVSDMGAGIFAAIDGTLRDAMSSVADSGSNVLKGQKALNDAVGHAFAAVGKALGAAGEAFGSGSSKAGKAVGDAVEAVGGAIGSAGSAIGSVVGSVGDWIGDFLEGGSAEDGGDAAHDPVRDVRETKDDLVGRVPIVDDLLDDASG